MRNKNYKKIIRDWKIVVITFAVLLLGVSGLAWKVYLSDQIGGGFFTKKVVVEDLPDLIMDSKRLGSAVLIMETKQADFTKVKATRSRLVDPSL